MLQAGLSALRPLSCHRYVNHNKHRDICCSASDPPGGRCRPYRVRACQWQIRDGGALLRLLQRAMWGVSARGSSTMFSSCPPGAPLIASHISVSGPIDASTELFHLQGWVRHGIGHWMVAVSMPVSTSTLLPVRSWRRCYSRSTFAPGISYYGVIIGCPLSSGDLS